MLIENEWYIEAPWGRICVVAWGHCYNPPVVVCHGVMDCIASFRPLIKMLPQNFYYIGIEWPGNGKSDSFPPGLLFNLYDLVYSLDVVVKHFRWENFVYLGHSAGAIVGMLYNFCFPGKITRLIQLDPVTPTIEPSTFGKWYKKTYQALFDGYEYYNKPKEQQPVYTRKEALLKLSNARSITEASAEDILDRVSEPANTGSVRLTFDQRYKVVPTAPLTPDQLKDLCVRSKAQFLIILFEESVKKGIYSKLQFLTDESIYDNNCRIRQVEGHHNIYIDHPELLAMFVSQFLLHGPDGLDSKSKL